MNRVRVLIALLLIFIIAVINGCSYKNNKVVVHTDNIHNTNSGKSIGFDIAFDMLNNSELFDMYSDDSFNGLSDISVEEYMDKNKPKYSEVLYNGNEFPRPLVSLMENALYNNKYDDVMKKLVTNNYRIDRNKLVKSHPNMFGDFSDFDNYTDIYKINLKTGNEYYVIVYKGGSSGNYQVTLENYKKGEENIIEQFDTPNYGNGSVIKYDDNYYYIYQEENFNFRFYDSIVIYKLETNGVKSLRISYVPDTFTWEKINNKQETNVELSAYINGIKDNLVNGNYIDRGKIYSDKTYYTGIDVFDVYKGDETEVKDVNNINYSIDFGNIGFPVYFSKYLGSTGSKNMSIHLTGEFYLYDAKSKSYKELSNLNLSELYRADKNKELMQMWFKNINKKIYMFRIFHLKNYSYILNVSLIENGKLTQIRNDILMPQNSFTLIEGKRFHIYM